MLGIFSESADIPVGTSPLCDALLGLECISSRFEMRWAYTEKPVTVLPVKIWNPQCLDKLRRILLENFQHLRCRKFLREIAENVNVIRHATYGD